MQLRDRAALLSRREQARAAQLADVEVRRDARRAEADARQTTQIVETEVRRAVLPEQLQGRTAGQDLASRTRPRRVRKPIDQLIDRQKGV